MAKMDFLSVLGSLDVQRTQAKIESQLRDMQKNLTSFNLNLGIDDKQFQKHLLEYNKQMSQLSQGALGEIFNEDQLNKQSTLLDQIAKKYQGLSYEVKKFSHDQLAGVSQATVSVKQYDDSIKQVQATLKKDGEVTFNWQPEIISTDLSKATKEFQANLNNISTKMQNLLKVQKDRNLTDAEYTQLLELQNKATGMAADHTTRLREALSTQAISASKYKELMLDSSLATEEFGNKINLTMEKLTDQEKFKLAKTALDEYSKKLKMIEVLETDRRAGRATPETNEKLKALQLETEALKQQIALNDEIDAKRAIADDRSNLNETSRKLKKQQEQERNQINGLAQAYKELEKATTAAYNANPLLFKATSGFRSTDGGVLNTEMMKQQGMDTMFPDGTLTELGNVVKQLDNADRIVGKIRMRLQESEVNMLESMREELKSIETSSESSLHNLQKMLEARGRALHQKRSSFLGEPVRKGALGGDLSGFTPEHFQDPSISGQVQENFVRQMGGFDAKLKKSLHTTKVFGEEMKAVTITVDQTKRHVRDLTYTYDDLNKTWHLTNEQVRLNAARMGGLGEQITMTVKRMAMWVSMGRLVYGTFRKMAEGFTFLRELDDLHTQIAIIQRSTRNSVKHLTDDFVQMGTAMKTSVLQIGQVYTELMRQGLAAEETSNRLQTIIKLSQAGAISVEQSIKVITAAVNGMKTSHEVAGDVILRSSQITASSVEEIGEALTKTASSAHAVGMSIQETTAIISGLIQTTQEGASQIGTSVKTILARFNAVNEETGELNTELNRVQKAFESVGIAFTGADGQIRNTYELLKEMAEIWDTLTRNQQAYIATTSAGTRMQSRFFALMNSFDEVENILFDLEDATGILDEGFETSLTSMQAAMNELQIAWEKMFLKLMDSEVLIFLANLTTGFVNLLNTMGPMNIVIGAFAGKLALSSRWLKLFQADNANAVKVLLGLYKAFKLKNAELDKATIAQLRLSEMDQKWIQTAIGKLAALKKINATTKANIAQQNIQIATNGKLSASFVALQTTATVAITSIGAAFKGLAVLMGKVLMPFIVFMAAATAASFVMNRITNWITGSANKQTMADDLSRINSELSALRDNSRSLPMLWQEYEELTAKVHLTSEEHSRLLDIQRELGEIVPEFVLGYDEYGNVIANNNLSLEEMNELLAEQRRYIDQDYTSNFIESYKEQQKEIDETSRKLERLVNLREMEYVGLTKRSAQDLGIDLAQLPDFNAAGGTAYNLSELTERELSDIDAAITRAISATSNKVKGEINKMNRSIQPVIRNIGHTIGITGESFEHFSFLVGSLDYADYSSLDDYRDAVFQVGEQFQILSPQFDNLRSRHDKLDSDFRDGVITAREYNEAIEKLKKDFADLVGVMNLPVSNEGMMAMFDKMQETAQILPALLDNLRMVNSQIEQNREYASLANRARTEYIETDMLSIGTTLELVEALQGRLDIEEFMAHSAEDQVEIAERMIAIMNDEVKVRQETLKQTHAHQIEISKNTIARLRNEEQTGAVVAQIKEEEEQLQRSIAAWQESEIAIQRISESLIEATTNSELYNQAFSDVTSKMDFYRQVMEEINSAEGLRGATRRQIVTEYMHLAPHIQNEADLLRVVEQAMVDNGKTQREMLKNKATMDENYFKATREIYSRLWRMMGEDYQKDFENFKTVNEMKAEISKRTAQIIGQNNMAAFGSDLEALKAQRAKLMSQMIPSVPSQPTVQDRMQQIATGRLPSLKPKDNTAILSQLQEVNNMIKVLEGMNLELDDFVGGIDFNFSDPSSSSSGGSKSNPVFRDILRQLPLYAEQLNVINKRMEEFNRQHELAFKRFSLDAWNSDNLDEYTKKQFELIEHHRKRQDVVHQSANEVRDVLAVATKQFQELTGISEYDELSFGQWRQKREAEIHKLQQDAKFIEDPYRKNEIDQSIAAMEFNIRLAETATTTMDSANNQIKSLQDEWWNSLSAIQRAMIDTTQTATDEISKVQVEAIKAINDMIADTSRTTFTETHKAFSLLMLDLRKLDEQFNLSLSPNLSTSGMKEEIESLAYDTEATLNLIEQLNHERRRVETDGSLSEIERRNLINEIIERQLDLQNTLASDSQLQLVQLAEMEIYHREIQDVLEYKIGLKEKELQQLEKQQQREEAIRREQQRQLDILKAMDDTRHGYIAALGQEILTYDRDRVMELRGQRDERNLEREKLEKELEELKEEQTRSQEIQRIQQEMLSTMQQMNDNLKAQTETDLQDSIQSLETTFEAMITQVEDAIKDVYYELQTLNGKANFDAFLENVSFIKDVESLFNKVFGQGIAAFDTGGYTGNFGSKGKLGILHEKELILNQGETKDFLQAISLLRNVDIPRSPIQNVKNNSKSTNIILKNPQFHGVKDVNKFERELDRVMNLSITSLG